MANFKISAPGRIILSGEHSAMYRKHFVATSINRRTELKFSQLSDEKQIIKIDFYNVKLHVEISLEEVQRFCSERNEVKQDPISVLHYVKSLITLNEELDIKPFRVRVSTELPIGAGLGSSTSFAVCLAACFLHWKRLQSGDHSIGFDDTFLENVRNYAKFCEKAVQDYECAFIDTEVCVYGKTIKCLLTEHIRVSTEGQNITRMKILLVDSKLCQRKCDQAKQMAGLKKNSPAFDDLISKLDIFATRIYYLLIYINESIGQPDPQRKQELLYDKLQLRIRENQQFLKDNNLSAQVFNYICSIANACEFAGKVTGFRGQFVYILLPPNIENERITNLSENLRHEGFSHIINTDINCDGVKIDN